ncbi:hypothetical protein IE81DRAFT_319274 [Ceraceosorus guamensis]|uniref:Uncharacterized protein n=1 Tax=Ceraceosorus guamensis TaxID=1522189 RepID=A0A316W8X3_9BASI|nr:hypothetical protein IE81DRAFT_319274 [Ceraceosorus guamensis]PWN46366.1 hypothetical protein IE81DRAFT_319274 [Ceraceosorus guamensis]
MATLDILICAALTALLLYGPSSDDPAGGGDDQAKVEKTRRLIFALAASGLIRATTVGVIGCSRKVRELTIAVAAICLVSILVIVSVSNVLFLLPAKARSMDGIGASLTSVPHHLEELPRLSVAYLSGQQLIFTLLEWALFVGVVGVRVPPGGVNAAGARRWQQALAAERWDGEVESLYEGRSGEQAGAEAYTEQATEADLGVDNGGETCTDTVRTPKAARPSSYLSTSAHDPSRPTSPLDHYTQPSAKLATSPPQDTLSPLPRSPAASISRRSVRSPMHAQHFHSNSRDLERQAPPSLGFPAQGPAEGEEEEEGEESELDPDDIVDINPNDRRLSRQESKRRLDAARARGEYERERKISSNSLAGATSLFSRSPTNATSTPASGNASRSQTPTGEGKRLLRGSASHFASDAQISRSTYGSTDLASRPSIPPSASRGSSIHTTPHGHGVDPSASYSSTSSAQDAQTPPSSGPKRLANRLKRPSWLPSTKKARRSASGQQSDREA